MSFRIAYEGDEQELLVAFCEALLSRAGEGNWLVQVSQRDGEVLEGRLIHADQDRLVVRLVDPFADYEPYVPHRDTPVDVAEVYEVLVP